MEKLPSVGDLVKIIYIRKEDMGRCSLGIFLGPCDVSTSILKDVLLDDGTVKRIPVFRLLIIEEYVKK